MYFSYVPEQKLIEDFNLHVQPGQRIAIVGPTGCGKTTLINLLMRFYDADSGHIQVSGQASCANATVEVPRAHKPKNAFANNFFIVCLIFKINNSLICFYFIVN